MNKQLFILLFYFSSLFVCPDLSADDSITKQINSMTLRQKVGQLLMIGFQGKDLDKKDIAHIKKLAPGGFILYRRNFNDASDIPQLIARIKSIMSDNLPVFFAIDQEGWIVHRINDELYTPPSAPALGAVNSTEISKEIGFLVGSGLRELGININFAPVLDISSDIYLSPMALRSFGNNPSIVESMGIAYINGIRESGILTSAKHFPGIGRTHEDTHNTLPKIVWKNDTEKKHDLLPFASAIKAGIDIIMPGHVIVGPGDFANPASLSPYWITNKLRKEMGFDGLVIVDSLEMKAITEKMSVSDAAIMAIKTGADIIMVCHERGNQKKVFDALLNATETGIISNERIESSLRRIFEAKKKLSSSKAMRKPISSLKKLSREIAENIIVYVKKKDVVDFSINKEDRILYAGSKPNISEAIKDYFMNVEILNMPLHQHEEKHKIPVAEYLNRFNVVIIDAAFTDALKTVSACKKLGIRHVVMLHHPGYAQMVIKRFQAEHIIVLFETAKTHIQTAMEIISGAIKAKGILPYNFPLPDNYVYVK